MKGKLKVSAQVIFEIRDIWVGLYWTRDQGVLILYLCLVPFLPIKVKIWREMPFDHLKVRVLDILRECMTLTSDQILHELLKRGFLVSVSGVHASINELVRENSIHQLEGTDLFSLCPQAELDRLEWIQRHVIVKGKI